MLSLIENLFLLKIALIILETFQAKQARKKIRLEIKTQSHSRMTSNMQMSSSITNDIKSVSNKKILLKFTSY